MIGHVGTFYVDRAPDFFALNRARGDTRTIVAELEGKPVGYSCYALREALVAGRPKRVVSGHDFRVDPTLCRPWVAIKISAGVFRRAAEDGCDYFCGMVAHGNVRAIHFTQGGVGSPKLRTGGLFCTFPLWPWRRPPRTRYQIESAREEDIPEIVDLINAHYRDHNFAPRYTPETFSAMLSSSLDYEIGDFFVARDRGEMVAVLGLWDHGRTKKMVLLRLHPALAFLLRLMRLIVRLLRLPLLVPRAGEPISSLYVRHAAVREGRKKAFRDLVHWVSAHTRHHTGGRRLIFAAAHERDTRLWRRAVLRCGVKVILFYHAFRPVSEAEAEALASRPFYDDFSLS